MIVVHIESGLGNQMLSYCEYLALKAANPSQEFYLETIVYEIPECNDTICQWNGYELERVFGIKNPQNIKSLFSEKEWDQIIGEIRATEFWIHNWNYPVAFTQVLKSHGLDLKNIRGDFDSNHNIITGSESGYITICGLLKRSKLWHRLRFFYSSFYKKQYLKKFINVDKLFLQTGENIFTGQWLSFKSQGNQIERIEDKIKDTFTFSEISDDRNEKMAAFLYNCNSVAIHARRGDMLKANGWCYKSGYFKRAVKYIKRHVDNPVFVFFTDPGSISWCRDHADIFALDFSEDHVLFVDWNVSEESYRDLQLMSCCKHSIITNSSFGWWGSYLIDYKNKITISPSIEINTTHHC